MKKRGKAQSAMEYLLTYGWAILIVLIAISALFYLGVFSPKTPNTCSIPAPFICNDVIIYQDSVGFLLGGNEVSDVGVNRITVNGQDCNEINGELYVDTYLDDINNQLVMIRCIGIDGYTTTNSKVTSTIDLEYETRSGLTHTITGQAYGMSEEGNFVGGNNIIDYTHIVDDNVVLSYDFEGEAKDLSGNGNDGILNGNMDCNAVGHVGDKACGFDGNDDFIEVLDDDSLDFGTGSFSIEAWVKTNTVTSNKGIIAKRTTSPTIRLGYEFHLYNNGRLGYFIGDGFDQLSSSMSSLNTNEIDDDYWHHTVLVFNRTTATKYIRAYIDGSQSGFYINLGSNIDSIDNTINLYVGKRYDNTNYYVGSVDSLVIYNKALSSEEILEHFCYTEPTQPICQT